ncbi:MAG: response regulator [Desulfobacula sp.]|nr:response regulator [Desulfobacula sp.]
MSGQKTILIIDDERQVRDSLEDFFQDDGYATFTASDGEEGLDIFFNNKIDIVITDLRMPKTDGIEVMQAIHKKNPETPMVVVSGAGKEKDIINALRMGAKDYIRKPIKDLNRIGLAIKHVLENKRLNEENIQYRKKLEDSEYKYRTITENIAEGVFAVDEFENFTYTNQAFCKITGYSHDEILQKNIQDICTKNSFKIIQNQTLERKKGLTGRYEIRIFHRNMKYIHLELACTPALDNENKYSGAYAIARDITKSIELKKKYKKFLGQKEKTQKNMIPICASCKNIRLQNNDWMQIEEYFKQYNFSHGICPECCNKLYPEFNLA